MTTVSTAQFTASEREGRISHKQNGHEVLLDPILDMIPRQKDTGRFYGIALSGLPGIGKTHYLMDLIKGGPVVRHAMATKIPETYGAYPVPTVGEVDGKKFAEILEALSESSVIPLLEENIGDGYGLLILDDITAADPRLQSACLELVQFGTIAGRRLGKNVLVGLTGNGVQHGAYAVEWSTALLGRCLARTFEPNFDYWLELPENQMIDPVIVGFLKDNADWFSPDIGHADNAAKFKDDIGKSPQPRTWTMLGEGLAAMPDHARNWRPSLLFSTPMHYYSSIVGEKAGVALDQWRRVLLDYPRAEELLNDPETWSRLPTEKKANMPAAMALTYGLRQESVRRIEASKSPKERVAHTQAFLDAMVVVTEQNSELFVPGFRMFRNHFIDTKDTKVQDTLVDFMTSDYFSQHPHLPGAFSAIAKVEAEGGFTAGKRDGAGKSMSP